MLRDYKILTNSETEMMVLWADTGQQITYPIPRDADKKALDGDDLDAFMEKRYDVDVAPKLIAQNNTAIESLVASGLTRNAKDARSENNIATQDV